MLDLEKALSKRCEADPQYATLLAQWTFDKQLVGRALQSVPQVFPHYSLHDASHADTILRQMARVLGPRRIERLSPTDLWLMLESAYHHDLGMVVGAQKMREWWNDKKFDLFLEGLVNHADEEVRRAAELLDKRREFRANGDAWPFDVQRALVLVMAEYARPRHPSQSRGYVEAPSLIDLQSPRTMLVPRRFWSLLGRICESHGQGFAETMKLPARESGFAMDDAHPRFVACMLRLGDLLDLDDGRFCPVLARTFGGLPPSSKAHAEKHHSIHEFLVDASEIRVLAECTTPGAFDATEQWLSWLRQELRDQGEHWANISPEPDFGSVPSAGRIEARLQGYRTAADGRRPRFDVDKEAMLDFVRGAGLYSDETTCIAELLQNAVDATLLRVWAANRRKWERVARQQDNGALEELRKALQKYPIDVRVQKSRRVGEENHWSVTIRDRGAGISGDDIPFLQSVGSSHKNPRKRERVQGMPEWMKPSGFFGIGLQSVFLFTDRVLLRSRADTGTDTIEIELWQAPGSKEPQILVRSVTGRQAMNRAGTSVRFTLREPKVPESFSYRGHDNEAERAMQAYDPLMHDELPILPSKVRDAARVFAETALAPIRVFGSSAQAPFVPAIDEERFFDIETGIELSIRASLNRGLDFYYRGRRTDEHFYVSLFQGMIVWHSGNASKILTVNREKIRSDAKRAVRKQVKLALRNVFPRYYEKVKDDAKRIYERRYASLAAQLNEIEGNPRRIPPDDTWKNLLYESSSVSLGEIAAADQIRLIEDPSWTDLTGGFRAARLTWDENPGTLTMTCDHFTDWLLVLVSNFHLTLESAEEVATRRRPNIKHEWLATREGKRDILADDKVLKATLRDAASPHEAWARRTIPCIQRFGALALSPEAQWGPGHVAHTYERLKPRALFPFRVEADKTLSLAGIEELVAWTYEHRAVKETTLQDVARAALDLVRTTDEFLRAEWGERAQYSVDDLARRFAKRYGIETPKK